MDDGKIIALYFERDESAVRETQSKYGKYLYSIAYNILESKEDAEECVNDTYLSAWNAIPPQKPKILSSYLAKIARNAALKRKRLQIADKRGGREACVPIDELAEFIPDTATFSVTETELSSLLSDFLRSLPDTERRVFILRYWYNDPIVDICQKFGFKESRVKMMLKRTREKLFDYLTKEGVLFNDK